ncbi:sugar isomerase domain-containing protein [soil metagenome]
MASAVDQAAPALRVVGAALDALVALDLTPVAAAADALAQRIDAGGALYVFGSGHSQLLALEGHYRAGGPTWVHPVLDDRLSPARGAALSTAERTAGIGGDLVAHVTAADALLVASTSGRNAVPLEVATRGRANGALLIALTSCRAGSRLDTLADHVLDTQVPAGDAMVEVRGTRMGPVSTVVGAALLHALLAETVERLATPEVLVSTNLTDNHNTHDDAATRRSSV